MNRFGGVLIVTVMLVSGCSSSNLTVAQCVSTRDCPDGYVCEDGSCTPGFTPPDGDQTEADRDIAQPDGDSENTESDLTEQDVDQPDGDLPDGDTEAELEPDMTVDGDEDPDPEVDEEQIAPGDACEDAMLLPLDTPTFGTTIGANNDLNPSASCGPEPLNGAEVVFRLTLVAGDEIRVTVAPSTEGFNPAIYILSACDSENTCEAFEDSGRGSQPDTLPYFSPNGGEVFLIVDSVIEPDKPGGQGDFVIAARRYPPVETCQPCGGDLPNCGPGSGCVEFADAEGVVETACVSRCEQDSDCEPGFACRTAQLDGGGNGMHCIPKYGDNQKHVLSTCAALLDMGTPCIWRLVSDNDAACGADDGREVDDAVCLFFPQLTDFVSYCTIYCVDDSECPQGYFCYKVPLTLSDRVCKLR
jgi:hypothetical protein